MSIKSSGLWCDICLNPILFGEWWEIRINEKEGHSCEGCKKKYEAKQSKENSK